jgi:hypothetical protein
MPEKETLERAQEDKREGKAPSTQAGEFVREEIEHVREGKHGARSTKHEIRARTVPETSRNHPQIMHCMHGMHSMNVHFSWANL